MISDTKESPNDDGWINEARHTYEYDDKNNLTAKYWLYWRNNSWEISSRRIYSYFSNKLSYVLAEAFNEEWRPVLRFYYKYDGHDNLISLKSEKYNDDQWVINDNSFDLDLNQITISNSGCNFEIEYEAIAVGVEEPKRNIIAAAMPNPFTGNANISYFIDKPGPVTISIFNSNGALIRILSDKYQTPGYYGINWDGSGRNSESLPSGRYFLKIDLNGRSSIQNLIMMK